jgi:hypothetical protein
MPTFAENITTPAMLPIIPDPASQASFPELFLKPQIVLQLNTTAILLQTALLRELNQLVLIAIKLLKDVSVIKKNIFPSTNKLTNNINLIY